jgi:hypothetical protein
VANEWCDNSEGERKGTVRDPELKSLAWKKGMKAWWKAGAVKRWFPQKNTSPPPPLALRNEDGSYDWPPQSPIKQESSSCFDESAKRARQLSANRAEQITTINEQRSLQDDVVAKAGRSLLTNTAVIISTVIFCVPMGLVLIWRHPTWEKQTKLKLASVSCTWLLVLMVLGAMQQSAAMKKLTTAKLSEGGKQADAIEKYVFIERLWRTARCENRHHKYKDVQLHYDSAEDDFYNGPTGCFEFYHNRKRHQSLNSLTPLSDSAAGF